MNKQTLFNQLKPTFSEIIKSEKSRDEKLKTIAQLLFDTFDHYDWVGFYITDPNAERELYLGPYVGPETDHTRIKFGVGICGQSADTHQTFVIDDVTKEANYLACSLTVKSEIVVPIMFGDYYVAQIDIDSNKFSAMDSVDKNELESLCTSLSSLWN